MEKEGSGFDGSSDNDGSPRSSRIVGAKLAPWQIRIAKREITRCLAGKLRLADIAENVRLSPTHFARAFKNSVGTTPYQWYQHERIARWMQLLRDKGKSLSEVASDCGFTDQSNFISSFHQIFGVSQ